MTDNSPEYFEQAAKDIEAFSGLYAYAATNNAVREMSFRGACRSFRDTFLSAATLARELTEAKMICGKSLALAESAEHRAESAESANRALQAEVDRLSRAVERKNEALVATPCLCKSLPQSTTTYIPQCKRCQAIAYTGTEPQEGTK